MKCWKLNALSEHFIPSMRPLCPALDHPRFTSSLLLQPPRCSISNYRRTQPRRSRNNTPRLTFRHYSSSSSSSPPQRWLHAHRIPPGAWDSHMHLVDPALYPLSPSATYTPSTHTLPEALAYESALGIANIVLVQPSVYANDNTLILDTLRRLGPSRARGVVAFDPASPPPSSVLHAWHVLGVRALRINLSSVGKVPTAADLRELLSAAAEICRPLGWAIQLYLPMDTIPLLEPLVPPLGVRIIIDHLGNPSLPEKGASDPYAVPGFDALAKLLEAGSTYVKLSAPYRLSKRPDHGDLEPLAREVLRLRGRDRVVFATDWPHTRFDGVDIRPWMERVLEWCGKDEELVDALFRRTAEELWGDHRG